jgi:hypothetical protein
VADVLTFYQERIANEGYLRTATERRSILELARLIGYRLRPGLAASVYLAYTLEPTQETTPIEPGNKAQSIPGPNELPQVFETAEKLIAYSKLNLVKPRMTQPQLFNLGAPHIKNPSIVLQGASANLRVNDAILLEFTPIGSAGGQPIVSSYRATEIAPEPALNRTTVKLTFQATATSAISIATPAVDLISAAKAIAERYQRLTIFGLSEKSKIVRRAVDRVSTSVANAKTEAELQILSSYLADEYAFSSSHGYDKIASWLGGMKEELEKLYEKQASSNGSNGDTKNGSQQIPVGLPSFVELLQPFKQPQSLQPRNEARLHREVGQIYSEKSSFVSRLYATLQPLAAPFVDAALVNAEAIQIPTPSRVGGVVELTQVQAQRQEAFLAGHSFPTVFRETTTGNTKTLTPVLPPTHRNYIDALIEAGLIDSDHEGEDLKDLSFLALDTEYPQIQAGEFIAVLRPHIEVNTAEPNKSKITADNDSSVHKVERVLKASLTLNQIPVTVTILKLETPWLRKDEQKVALPSNALVRRTTVYVQGEKLPLAEAPIESLVGPTTDDPTPLIELDGLYSSLEPGRWVILSGELVVRGRSLDAVNTGVRVSELVMVAAAQHEAKTLVNGELVEVKGEKLHTFIRPAQTPAYTYKRDTVKIYGNIVRATHGETRNEVMGSGDGGQTLQMFPLRQAPLTYLAAPTPSGVQTTLEVRVNDIRWREAANLFTLARSDRGYITKTGDDGKTVVIFGNGEHGTRLPTGVENVKAVYRSGIGQPGNVKAEQIKLPMTKPLGVKGVINPLPASGGADRESGDQARRNAPLATLALDRLVSVRDYADFSRTFAGIAKADARQLSDGAREIVHLTIAGAGNIPIDITSDLYRNLLEALKRFGDPFQPLEVEVFERVLLVISAKVNLHPDYLWESVKPKIRAALLDRFGFESRELGQDVTASEVLSVIQAIPGVNYIDLDLLDSVDEEKLKDPNFGASLSLCSRVNAKLARVITVDDTNDILPAQLVFLSAEATDTLILEEVAG